MKKISTLEKKLNASAFAFVVAMAATSYSHAHTSGHHHGHGAYVGLDAVYNWMGFKKDYGQNIFKKQAPGVNMFVGYMFHENFGAEVGFEWDKKVKKDVTIQPGETLLGYPLTVPMGAQAVKTNIKQSHPYLALVAKTNVIGENCFVGLMLGMSLSNIKLWTNNYLSNGSANNNGVRTFSKTKLIPLVKATFENKFNHQFGMRISAAWKNTSAFKLDSKEVPTRQVKLKDTFSVGVGVCYYI